MTFCYLHHKCEMMGAWAPRAPASPLPLRRGFCYASETKKKSLWFKCDIWACKSLAVLPYHKSVIPNHHCYISTQPVSLAQPCFSKMIRTHTYIR